MAPHMAFIDTEVSMISHIVYKSLHDKSSSVLFCWTRCICFRIVDVFRQTLIQEDIQIKTLGFRQVRMGVSPGLALSGAISSHGESMH